MKPIHSMSYWELRTIAAGLVPRQTLLTSESGDQYRLKQKGRKSNYHQYDLASGQMEKLERILSQEGLNSFVEVSLRAQSCPMPLNLDTWDGLKCPMGCKYCIPAGTKVLMADGTEKVAERVYVGDKVLSMNLDTMKPEVAEVTEVMNHEADGLIFVSTGEHEMEVTPDHPVFTKRGWVITSKVEIGDEVLVW